MNHPGSFAMNICILVIISHDMFSIDHHDYHHHPQPTVKFLCPTRTSPKAASFVGPTCAVDRRGQTGMVELPIDQSSGP